MIMHINNNKIFFIHTFLLQVLNAIPDQDAFYDVTDSLEELGMERITQRHMNRKGADLDLLSQFQIFDVIYSTIIHVVGLRLGGS